MFEGVLPPGPPMHPLRNLARWLIRPLPMLDDFHARYGNMFTMRLPRVPAPMVVFAEPDAVREIWALPPDIGHAGAANQFLSSVLGENSLIVLDGDRHLRDRRLMLPPFHGDRMKAYGETMREVTAREVERWPIGEPFAAHAAFQAIALDVIMHTIFGVGSDDPRLAPLRDALVRWTTRGTSRLGTAMLLMIPPERLARLLAVRSRFVPWADLSSAHQETDRLVRELIATRRREPASHDIMSLLLAARDESGASMTDDQLRDEMLTLLVAGHETTATTLAWTLHHLLAHPEWLARARADEAVLEAAIKETLRLTPIIPMVSRVLAQPTTIGGVDLPRGAVALACIYLVHRRADLWPEPLRFDPSRFVGKKTDPATYFPFGGGIRRCLGMAFATYEMKIVLSTILSRCDLTAAPGRRVRLVRRGITFAPSGGMPIVVTRRAPATS
jgi:cytochrome P450